MHITYEEELDRVNGWINQMQKNSDIFQTSSLNCYFVQTMWKEFSE